MPLRAVLAVAGLALGLQALLQAAVPGPVDPDGYYHAKIAALYGRGVFPREFPWMAWSVFADWFVDAQLGLHLLTAPFTWIAGGLLPMRLAAATFAAALSVAAFAVMARLGVARLAAAVVAVVLPLASIQLGVRLLGLRATPLMVALVLAMVPLLAEGRRRGVFLACAAGTCLYHGFLVLPGIVVVHAALEAAARRKIPWGLLAASVAGVALGLLVNPSFPANVAEHVREWLNQFSGTKAEVPLSQEWLPMPALLLLQFTLPATAALGLALAVRGRPLDPIDKLLLVLAALFFAATCFFNRFAEYYVPVALVAAARVGALPLARLPATWRARKPALGAALAACLAALSFNCEGIVRNARIAERDTLREEVAEMAGWLSAHAPEGALVVAPWDDFSQLFFHDDRQRYVVGLNPAYLYRKDARQYRRYTMLFQNRILDPENVVAGLGSDLLLVRTERTDVGGALAARVADRPAFALLHANRAFALFQRRASAPPPR